MSDRERQTPMPKVLFIDSSPEIDRLWRTVHRADDIAIDCNLARLREGDIARKLAGYDTAIVDASYLTAETLSACRGLRHIVFLGTGAGSFIDLEAAAKLGITVSTIRGYGDTAVAEHAMALTFAAARHVAVMHEEVRRGGWRVMPGIQLTGKSIGLVGLGGIGREMARLAGGIGMTPIAWNRSGVADAPVEMVGLEELFQRADVVSLHLALSEATRGFVSRDLMKRMKPGAILVNTARAAVVDEAALIEFLRAGHIGHYATDVFCAEPPRSDDPLLGLDNVTLTAHAGFNTPEAAATLYRRAIDLAAKGW